MSENRSKLKESLVNLIKEDVPQASVSTEGSETPFEEAAQDDVPLLMVQENAGETFRERLENKDTEPSFQDKGRRPGPKRATVPKKVKPANKRNWKGGTVSGVALVMSFLALLGTGYSGITHNEYGQEVNHALNEINSVIETLTEKTNQMVADIVATKAYNDIFTTKIGLIDSLAIEMKTMKKSIDGLGNEVDSLSMKLEGQVKTIGEHSEQLVDLKNKYKALTKKPKIVRTTRKKTPKVVRGDPSMIAGARLASLDLWGTQPYAVLRDPSGKWIPLTSGDYYKGWRFSGAVGPEAIFKKGQILKKITIEG